ncbi:tripartite tricarboxylate transporter substrate binding protein [Belnapia sp. T6]|uniref:Tripartite tricarboxylate transporter substrate binding protein n=1 Tax=Belnapia mucosa TaxID=2804532 RepID=A0ABS1V429_9PROT|nr:tripartite tricarboxylate transporter substrate binding protein [Belnapia mucosa]MBL6456342.1 tripartite tricarboxylate transporter substrate binding protein [Belnapia mucosa]
MTATSGRIGRRTLAGLLPLAAPALAQPAWPDRPVRLLVGFAPGGTADVIARLLAGALQPRLGQPLVIENRSGAAGMLALQQAAHAAPDGATFAYANIGQVVLTPLLQPRIAALDPARELLPVAHAVNIPFCIGCSAALPCTTLAEFLALARAQPGAMNYGSSGVGQMTHVAVELLRARTGIELTHVPFRSGAQAVQEMAAGRIQLAMEALSVLRGPAEAGQVRILAIAGASRSSQAPEVPTAAEAGVADFVVSGWQGFFAPTGLPTPILTRFAGLVREALDSPAVRNSFAQQGFEPGPGDAAAFASFVAAERARWTAVVQQAGIRAE